MSFFVFQFLVFQIDLASNSAFGNLTYFKNVGAVRRKAVKLENVG